MIQVSTKSLESDSSEKLEAMHTIGMHGFKNQPQDLRKLEYDTRNN